MTISIKKEISLNFKKVWQINFEAFGRDAEGDLVDLLRNAGITYISLVAVKDGEVVGHIMFTPVELLGCDEKAKLMGLGPMAVKPEFQKMGIGSRLVKASLEECKNDGYEAVVVLGHPDYYPRFGFVPSIEFGIKCEYDVPSEAFMILELKNSSLNGRNGIIKYQEAFGFV